MSLYAQYIKERLNKEIIETEKGYAVYFFIQDGVYIEDIFVSPDHRHSHEAARMANEIADIARKQGYTKMYGSVKPSANYSTDSLKVLIAYGMKLKEAGPDAIIMVKDI